MSKHPSLEYRDFVARLAFNRREVAALLGVSYGHILNEIKRKRLREISSGTRKLVPRAELDRYLAAEEQEDQSLDSPDTN